MSFRTYKVMLAVDYLERLKIKEDAKRHKLSVPDYVRLKLGLPTRKEAKEKLYEGDPDNAVDVEELTRAIFEKEELYPPAWTMADARREAKRRLRAARES